MPQLSLVSQFGSPTLTSLRVTGNTILGSNLNILGSATISGSLTVNSLIVNTTNVITGSTIFGSSPANTHQFTGSITTSGSITVTGQYNGSGAGLTSIPNGSLSNSTISGIALGSNLATLTIGAGLSGTSYNGSGAVTIANSGVTSNVAGTGITVSGATGAVTITNSDRGSSQNIFKNVAVSGQSTVVADGNDDTLTLAGAGATTITTNASTDTITISSVNTTYSVGDGGLTQVNFTTTRRDKLDGIAANATNVTNNNQLTNGAGYITSAGTSADSGLLNGISAVNLFNNMGGTHSTRTSFDASTPSYGFGFRYVQGSGNGPGTGGGQYYSWYIGLGSEYPATGGGSYGAMFAVDRNTSGPYLSVRYNENNSFGSWRRIYAGYADSAGGVAWTSVSGRPTALSQFSNDLGNYGNWYSNSGGTISGDVTINGSSNTVLTLNATEPHLRIAATGASNVAGIVIVPTSGYDAFVGNFNNGATNIMANSVKIGQFRRDGNSTDLRMGTGASDAKGSVSFFASNFGNGYEGRISGADDGNTHFYHRNNNSTFNDVGYFNQSGFYIDVLGGASDIRLKDIIETNPVIAMDGIDVIKYTFKSNPSLTRYGYSAQQVQSVLPDLITINSPISGSADEGTLMLNYNDLHVLKIAALERKVAQLEADIVALKS